jgi:hypothetical protein
MEFKNGGVKSAIDEYFEKFRGRTKSRHLHSAARYHDDRWQTGARSCRRRAGSPDSSGKDRVCERAIGLHTFLCGFDRDGRSPVLSGGF